MANQVAIAVDNALAYQKIAELNDKLSKEKLYLEGEIRTDHNFEEIISESTALKRGELTTRAMSTEQTSSMTFEPEHVDLLVKISGKIP